MEYFLAFICVMPMAVLVGLVMFEFLIWLGKGGKDD